MMVDDGNRRRGEVPRLASAVLATLALIVTIGQHLTPCTQSVPKPGAVSAPVHYHKTVNIVGFGDALPAEEKKTKDLGNLVVSRKELDSRIKFLRHTMDSLRDQLEFAKLQRGERGRSGTPGSQGPAGKSGKNGKDGHNGKNGEDGKRGKPGKEGPPGPPGGDGKNGYSAGGGWTMQLFKGSAAFSHAPDWGALAYLGSANVPRVDFQSWKAFHHVIGAVPKENFAWRFYGKVMVEKADSYKLCTVSDDRSRVFVAGHLVLDNTVVGKRVCAFARLEPGLHPILVDGFNNGGPGGVKLTYSGKDTKGEEKGVRSADARAVPAPLPSRFTLRMFASTADELKKVPELVSEGELVGDAIVPKIDFRGTGAGNFAKAIPATPNSHYFYQFFGKLAVHTGGEYTLCLTSSDGSTLDIDEKRVVDNDGVHSARAKCQAADLAPGLHDVLVQGFLGDGSVRIEADYSGPDTLFINQPLRSVDPAAPAPPRPSQWLLEVFRPTDKYRNLNEVPHFPSALMPDAHSQSKLHPVGDALVPVLSFHGGDTTHGFRRYIPRTPVSDFAFVAYGTLEVASPGEYTFCTNSKDGSKLEVDGWLVVNNDGIHQLRKTCGTQVLQSGLHLVKVRGFHSGGRVEMEATYKGADTVGEYVLIPSVQGNAF